MKNSTLLMFAVLLFTGLGLFACQTSDSDEYRNQFESRYIQDSIMIEQLEYKVLMQEVLLDSMTKVINQDYAALSVDLAYLFKAVNRVDSIKAVNSGDIDKWQRRGRRTSAFLKALL